MELTIYCQRSESLQGLVARRGETGHAALLLPALRHVSRTTITCFDENYDSHFFLKVRRGVLPSACRVTNEYVLGRGDGVSRRRDVIDAIGAAMASS